MSLQFVIDGYNVIKHAAFNPASKNIDRKIALAEFISLNKLCGSRKNKVLIVFDGFPEMPANNRGYDNIEFSFSGEKTADEVIKRLIEASGNPKNIIVVSDDREIRFFIRAAGACPLSVEEFVRYKKSAEKTAKQTASIKQDLTYSQMDKINKELRQLWLK
ncbi:MAG: NYN domain-containing protein [Candidatus Omnitrophica bacterium]|nr:NYN domain-containing protein [Candidatus Omnitrophota bacterium]